MRTTLVFLVCVGIAVADDAGDVAKVDQQWCDAIVRRDSPALEKIMADDLHYVHGNASIQTKQQFLADVKGGAMIYHSLVASDRKARAMGDAVVVTESPHMKILIDGKEQEFTARFLRVYQKRAGNWVLVFHQATRVP